MRKTADSYFRDSQNGEVTMSRHGVAAELPEKTLSFENIKIWLF
jgi:hypothetical protein